MSDILTSQQTVSLQQLRQALEPLSLAHGAFEQALRQVWPKLSMKSHGFVTIRITFEDNL